MHRIDTSTAAVTPPTPKPAGTPGYFRDGDSALGQLGTVVPADFLNAVMMELANVITAAGITLSKTNNSQLLAALNSLFGYDVGSTGSNALNGWRRTPGGTIFQWGTGATVTGDAEVVSFPQPFPNGCFNVVITEGNGAGWTTGSCSTFSAYNKSASQFLLRSKVFNITTNRWDFSPTTSFNWQAVGW